MKKYNVIPKVYCHMSGVPWYHSLVWWFRDFYPYGVDIIDDNGYRIIKWSKSFRCRLLAERFIKKNSKE